MQTVAAKSSRAQSVPNVRPEFVFGLTTGVSGNCLHVNDHTIVYPVAGVVVVYDMETRGQKFIKLQPPRRVVTAMDLNATNHVLAVATVRDVNETTAGDSVEDKPTISVYSMTSLDLKCVFVEPDHDDSSRTIKDPPRYFSHVQFLYDNMSMAALATNHDGSGCSMYCYRWRNSTVDTCVRIDGHVAAMALNPIDTSVCCFVGKDLFRLMNRTDEDWTQYGFREANGIDFTCVCWLSGDRCLAGTTDGLVIVFANGELQAWYRADVLRDLDVTAMNADDERPKHVDETGSWQSAKAVRRCFTSLYGLVLVVGDSAVHYFEKTDEGCRYVKSNVFVKREDRYLQSQRTDTEKPKHFVENAYVSPNGEKLVCVTKRAQLYWAQLHGVGDGLSRITVNADGNNIDIEEEEEQEKEDEEEEEKQVEDEDEDDRKKSVARDGANPSAMVEIEVQPLGELLHHGSVKCVSASLWKPIFMTCGKADFSIKVWDYAECTLLLSKSYPRRVRSVSMHPTGLYSIAAFSDYVEFQLVESDDLVPLKCYTFSGCTACAFSRSGHMFALAKLDAIDVYCSVLFEKRFSCRGNPQAFIEILLWTNDDANLVAYDSTGNLCTFDTKTGKLVTHVYVYSMAAHANVVVTADVDRMFVTARDGVLTELYNKKVVRELNLHQGPLGALSISTSNSTLFVSSKNGTLMAIALPIMYQIELKEFNIHNHEITTMCSVPDESVLITCAEDGSMCVWKVTDSANKTDGTDVSAVYIDDILINWSKYQSIVINAEKLEATVHRLETQSANAINTLKSSNDRELETVKTANAAYCRETDENNKDRVAVQKNAIRELENELLVLRETNERVMTDLDMQYCDQLASKYTRNLTLQNQAFAVASESNKDFETFRQSMDSSILETERVYEEKLKEKDERILLWKNKLNDQKNCLTMLVENIEDDCDKQILKKRRGYAAKLKSMNELYLKTTREADEFKMKHKLYVMANTDLNNSVELLEVEIEKLKESTGDKHNKVTGLTRLLQQLNEVDVQKTVKIQTIVQQLIKLEKELDLLNDNIASLEQIAEQLTLEIQKRQEQIDEYELKDDHALKTIKRLNFELVELKDQKKECVDELEREKLIVLDQSNFINQMKVDMYAASKYHHQSRNVKDANERVIQEFFRKYVGPTAQHTHVPDDEELEARLEFARQRKCLEAYVNGLKKTIRYHTAKNESYYLVLEENTKLIDEIEVLQKAVKQYSTRRNDFKCSLLPDDGVSRKRRTRHDDDDSTTFSQT